MDLSMPGMSGIEAIERIASIAPRVRVLVLTILADESDVLNALLAGACGYLLKDATTEEIVTGIQAAAQGDSKISPRIASKLVRHLRERPAPAADISGELTKRELEVLELLARGLDNASIASELYISQNTVKNHVTSILSKLQVENRIQAAVRAARSGL
jgi:DNA-binding NarL/FixJ family response regulator